jgi:uncharacterized cofD-like protein
MPNTLHGQEYHHLADDPHPHIVCIGGGTGLFTMLTGIKEEFLTAQISAIVTMMDSGGSTGRLRDEFGYLPPGDVRQCLTALSEAPEEMRLLMQHRFDAPKSSLHGHTVGNILLTAAKDITGTHDQLTAEYAAIEYMERIMRIRGKVYPVTLTNCHLLATLEDGTTIHGETNIDRPKHNPNLKIIQLELEPRATIFSKTEEAIETADYILIGPGDIYTSIMPNLVVDGMRDALAKARANGAKIIYIVNTMTKNGETNDFTATDFVRCIREAAGAIDAVIVNTGTPSKQLLFAYKEEYARPVVNDLDDGELLVIAQDLMKSKDFARHDSKKLANAVQQAIEKLS